MNSIEFVNCSKNYLNHWLFKDFSYKFDIVAGNSYAFLGRNGSGKSTLTLMLVGQTSPTQGNITWRDREKQLEVHQLSGMYSLSSPAMDFPEELTLSEWFYFQSGMNKLVGISNPSELIESSELPKKAINKTIQTFSSGMKQRLKLVYSFYSNSILCVLDEPLSNLDNEGIKLYERFIEQKKNEKCLVVASNREDEYFFVQHKLKIDSGIIQPL
jgi:ABC-type multidrug transport system ATPase subunit